MEKNGVKATIKLEGKIHEILISKERAEQIKRLQQLIKEGRKRKLASNNNS